MTNFKNVLKSPDNVKLPDQNTERDRNDQFGNQSQFSFVFSHVCTLQIFPFVWFAIKGSYFQSISWEDAAIKLIHFIYKMNNFHNKKHKKSRELKSSQLFKQENPPADGNAGQQ